MNTSNIKVIAFDADDTLWGNEEFFRNAELEFCKLMKEYGEREDIMKELFKLEVENLNLYGFGVKGFVLSMVETALRISEGNVSAPEIAHIISIGKEMLGEEITLLNGVAKTLETLHGKHKLVVATKGDLLDQERKLEKSGLSKYFHHIEVMSDKKAQNYTRLIKHLDIEPQNLLMVGNSLKSDILPVVELGGQAVYIPYHTTWEYEQMEPESIFSNKFYTLNSISELPNLLNK